jgi:NADH-quinone oxidoreductase subunit N
MLGVTLQWQALIPLVVVATASMLILMLEVMLSSQAQESGERPRQASERRLGLLLALVATGALMITILVSWTSLTLGRDLVFDPMSGMFRVDGLASVGTALVCIGAMLSVWLSSTYLIALHINHGEYYALLLLSTAGMLVAVSAQHLMLLFVGLELLSSPVYVLAAFDRGKLQSNEAGMKYFLMGSFASAILLFGMAFLYGATGRLDYEGIRAGLIVGPGIGMAGVALLLIGLSFKVALAPFHQWVPDVYEGAPTPVTAFMSVCVKAAAVLVLLRVVLQMLPELQGLLADVFYAMALISILVGNLMAVIQVNVKRMLAYSSIAHVGYLGIALVAGTPDAHSALLFYLFVYVFMNVGAFGVLITVAAGGRDCERIEDLAGIAHVRPWLAAALTLFMLSLAGIPGTAGFWAKLFVFNAAVGAGQVGLVIAAVLGSVVSLYFYLRLPIAMYMREAPEGELGAASTNEIAVLMICAAVVLYLGFFPNAIVPGLGMGLVDLMRTVVGG